MPLIFLLTTPSAHVVPAARGIGTAEPKLQMPKWVSSIQTTAPSFEQGTLPEVLPEALPEALPESEPEPALLARAEGEASAGEEADGPGEPAVTVVKVVAWVVSVIAPPVWYAGGADETGLL
nr:hypothetical protein B0A51_05768 [Rachicladosporium sp. CCFEE 5018]